MLMSMSFFLIMIMGMLFFHLNKYMYFISNLMFFMSFIYLFNLNFFCDWIMISMTLSINYYSYGLILLSLWIMGLVIMSLKFENFFNFCMNLLMLMNLIMLMNFMSMNLLNFYLMFEISLLLIFILIMKYGLGNLRIMASYYLMFYTLIFSVPLLLILFYLMNIMGTELFMIMEIYTMNLNLILFMIMIMAFLLKFPMFLMHGWLLKAHVEAPVFGSMILAAIMLKLGSYGLLRMMFIFYQYFLMINFYFIEFSLFGCVILSLLCLRQMDMKILVAMSSVVHMGLLLASMFTLMKISFLGSYLMMISHGLCSSGMFYMLNLLYMESNSRLMIINKGLINLIPSMSLMWFLLCSSNMAAPFSLNLVSEIFLLIGLVSWMKIFIIKLMLYCLISFMYSLYFYSYINHGNMNMNLNFCKMKLINYLNLIIHWIPLNFMLLNLFMLI